MRTKALFVIVMTTMCGALLSGCPCGVPEPVTLTELSGRFGYAFEGPYGLEGTLTKEAPGQGPWMLEGTFYFPTSGYKVLGPEVEIMESFPEQVRINLRVMTPPPGMPVLQVITPEPVRIEVDVDDRATFEITVQDYCQYESE